MRSRSGWLVLSLSIGGVALLALTPALAASGNRRPSDAERGQELYERHCQACHGTFGRGDGPATSDLVKPVPTMEGVVTKATVNDQVAVVLIGRGTMPGFEASFDRYDARRVLRHLAGVSDAPVPAQAAKPAPSEAALDSDQADTAEAATDAVETDAVETDEEPSDSPATDAPSTDAP